MKEKKTKKQKAIFYTNIICIILIVGIGAIIAINLYNTWDYKKVEAEIIKIRTSTSYNTPNYRNTYYITYKFELNNEKYQIVKKSLVEPEKEVGDTVYLRSNPDNPEEIANNSFLNTCYFLIASIILFLIILNINNRRKKVQKRLYFRYKDDIDEKDKPIKEE